MGLEAATRAAHHRYERLPGHVPAQDHRVHAVELPGVEELAEALLRAVQICREVDGESRHRPLSRIRGHLESCGGSGLRATGGRRHQSPAMAWRLYCTLFASGWPGGSTRSQSAATPRSSATASLRRPTA